MTLDSVLHTNQLTCTQHGCARRGCLSSCACSALRQHGLVQFCTLSQNLWLFFEIVFIWKVFQLQLVLYSADSRVGLHKTSETSNALLHWTSFNCIHNVKVNQTAKSTCTLSNELPELVREFIVLLQPLDFFKVLCLLSHFNFPCLKTVGRRRLGFWDCTLRSGSYSQKGVFKPFSWR